MAYHSIWVFLSFYFDVICIKGVPPVMLALEVLQFLSKIALFIKKIAPDEPSCAASVQTVSMNLSITRNFQQF